MSELTLVAVTTVRVSIEPADTSAVASALSAKPSSAPTPLAAAAAPSCPFSRLAPAGTACPITGALAIGPALSPPPPPAPVAPSTSPCTTSERVDEYADAQGEPAPALALAVVPARRRCPWWARLLRWSVKAVAKRAVMRSLRPVFRFGFGGAAHMWRNVRRGQTIAQVAGGAASIIGGVVVDGVEGGECPLGFK